MDRLFLEFDTQLDDKTTVLDKIRDFFGKDYNLSKKVFTNELEYAVNQKDKDLLILTTELDFYDIDKNSSYNKLCVLKLLPWADVEELDHSQIKTIHYYSKVMAKYGKTFTCTSQGKCPQSMSLDKNQFFNYTKAGFIFYNDEKPDAQSYKNMGFNYIGLVRKDM